MGLGRLLTRQAPPAPAETRAVTGPTTVYTATDTTGASQSWTVYNGIAPDWAAGTYGAAARIPGAWRASLLLSDLLGQVPWDAYRRRSATSREELIYPPPPLLDQPAPPDVRMVTFSSMGLDLILNGNAIGVVAARGLGNWPSAFVPVPATLVQVRRVGRYDQSGLPPGSIEYMVGDKRGLTPQDIIHVKGPCAPGALRGMGVLEHHMDTLNLANEQKNQARSVSSHGVPSGVIKSDDPDLGPNEAADLRGQWMANQASRTVQVINASTTFQPIAWNPEELELVEARKFTLTELELIFGLPVGWLGGQTSSRTYSNIEQDAVNLIKFSLAGHLTRFEQTLSAAQPRGTVTRANLDAILRADTLTRFQAYEIAIRNGWMLVEEVREREHMPPLPDKPPEPDPFAALDPALADPSMMLAPVG
jgi:HK97 family phage portal protein